MNTLTLSWIFIQLLAKFLFFKTSVHHSKKCLSFFKTLRYVWCKFTKMNFKNLKYDMTHIIQSLDHVFFKFITKDTVSWFIGPSQPFSDFCIQDQGNILKWVNWYYYLIAQYAWMTLCHLSALFRSSLY